MAATPFNFKQILKAINFEIIGNNGLNLVVRSKAFLKKNISGLKRAIKNKNYFNLRSFKNRYIYALLGLSGL